MSGRLQALGDSFTCGEGVGLRVPLDRTWPGRLAGAMRLEHRSLARPGARVRDVVAAQLPLATRSDVSTLLVGLNDVARPGFEPDQVVLGLQAAVEQLAALSDVVLVGRLHDPVRVLRLPLPLRAVARRRLDIVNATVDAAAASCGAKVLDLDEVPELRRSGAWAVDRVHPGISGHAALARAAAALLGVALPVVPVPRAPGLIAHYRWCARHGAPYLAGQAARQLLGAARPA